MLRAHFLFGSLAFAAACATAQPSLTRAEQEEFLRAARVTARQPTKKGVTQTTRVTLSDGRITHDAHVQTVDINAPEYRTDKGIELNFRDTYKFNIAAYRLDKLLRLGMIPVSVPRDFEGKAAAFTWWVDDVIGDERDREKGKFDPPDHERYNGQMHAARVFANLIYNTDPNTGNFLTDRWFDLWTIDFTRAFRRYRKIMAPADLTRCDRGLLANLRKLDPDEVRKELSPYVLRAEIDALLARRDLIVKHFDRLIAAKGEAAVLYDVRRTAAE